MAVVSQKEVYALAIESKFPLQSRHIHKQSALVILHRYDFFSCLNVFSNFFVYLLILRAQLLCIFAKGFLVAAQYREYEVIYPVDNLFICDS
jgi:hypothetical protein